MLLHAKGVMRPKAADRLNDLQMCRVAAVY
jgi:hypothetical protein